jgi:hypothetical protein
MICFIDCENNIGVLPLAFPDLDEIDMADLED